MGVNQIADSILAFIEGDDPGCRLLAVYLEEAGPSKADWGRRKAKDYPAGRAILKSAEAFRIGVLFAAYRLPSARQLFMKIAVVQPLIQDVFRSGITLSEANLMHFCHEVAEHSVSDFDFPAKQCIVPGRGDNDRNDLFLPFEGGRMLAIILSKAFLLADDTAIKDPAIVSQIKR